MPVPLFVLSLLLLGTTGSFSLIPTGVTNGLFSAPAPVWIGGAHSFPTPIHHVFVVVLEDASRPSVLSNGPFERQLADRFASSSQFNAVCHPSAPNYLAMTFGNPLQCGSDAYATYSTGGLGDLAQSAGISWGAFMESMPTACDTTSAYPYTVAHNPFVYDRALLNRPTVCAAHDLPFTSWSSDVSQGTIPAFGFFSPNLQNDGHDTGVAGADQWLASWLPPLMNDSFYASSVFFVAYDESVGNSTLTNGSNGGNVYFAAVSPYARTGYLDTQFASPYNLYATAAWLLGLPLTTSSTTANLYVPMKQLFRFSGTLPTLAAHGSGTPLAGVVPLTTSFSGSATGGTAPYSFNWSFGDGGTSSLANPSHRYTSAGTFAANLTVVDAAGARSTAVVTVVVSSTNPPLVAHGSGAPLTGVAPLTTSFTGSATGGTAPYSFNWSFGDGSTSSLANPSHGYTSAGAFAANLTVVDAAAARSTAVVTIVVSPANGTLAAHGSGTPLAGVVPLTTSFSGSATGGTAPYSFNWSFGDGGTSSLANPSHRYTSAGTFAANLTVVDAASGRSMAVVTVAVSPASVGVNATLVAGAQVATVPSTFWSVDAQAASATGIWTSSAVKTFLNATPFTWYRYGAGTEACNISTDTSYSSSGVASHGCAFNLTALKNWCAVHTPCHTILDLPGENNNSAEDAAIAKWTVSTLGFQPDYWSIGNEPTGWTHYGIPWTQWKSNDSSTPTAVAYAFDVKAAIAAVKAVDPAAKFIGIEAACSCNTAWFPAVAKVDGANISAIAYHSYPSTGSTTVQLGSFYSPLTGAKNLSSTNSAVRALIAGACTSCATMPIFVNEYNAGPGWAPSNLGGSYANAVFLAASLVQALRANVSQLTLFNLQTGSSTGFGYAMMNAKGTIDPVGTLFTHIAPKIASGAVYATGIRSTDPGLWSVLTENATAESLLVVNTNLTQAPALHLGTAFPTAVLGEVDLWGPNSTAAPNSTSGLIASVYTVPAQGILLLVVPIVNGTALAPLPSAIAVHPVAAVAPALSALQVVAGCAAGLAAVWALVRSTALSGRRPAA